MNIYINYLYYDYFIGKIQYLFLIFIVIYYNTVYVCIGGGSDLSYHSLNYVFGRNEGPVLIAREPRKFVQEVLNFSRIFAV